MSSLIGLDIGGSKTAGAAFADDGHELGQIVMSIPKNYPDLLSLCRDLVAQLESKTGAGASVGVGIAGVVDRATDTVTSANIPYMKQRPFQDDLAKILQRPVRIANDAVCAALAEAVEGAGKGYSSVFSLILGTGVGGAQVIGGTVIENTAGIAGEIGHRPLPFREPADGPVVACACGQHGCIDKSVSGPALARLYKSMTGTTAEAAEIGDRARQGDAEAKRVLDQFYTTIAKAMIVVLEDCEPDIITVSGGLTNLLGLYDEVPKRWGLYLNKNPKTKLVPATFGAMSGLRGAAWLGR